MDAAGAGRFFRVRPEQRESSAAPPATNPRPPGTSAADSPSTNMKKLLPILLALILSLGVCAAEEADAQLLSFVGIPLDTPMESFQAVAKERLGKDFDVEFGIRFNLAKSGDPLELFGTPVQEMSMWYTQEEPHRLDHMYFYLKKSIIWWPQEDTMLYDDAGLKAAVEAIFAAYGKPAHVWFTNETVPTDSWYPEYIYVSVPEEEWDDMVDDCFAYLRSFSDGKRRTGILSLTYVNARFDICWNLPWKVDSQWSDQYYAQVQGDIFAQSFADLGVSVPEFAGVFPVLHGVPQFAQ